MSFILIWGNSDKILIDTFAREIHKNIYSILFLFGKQYAIISIC